MSLPLLRVAILGVGNELNGDDAAGVLAVRLLMEQLTRRKFKNDVLHDHLYIADAGPAPEAFTGPLRRFHPDLVIIIDSAELGDRPGSVRWLEWQTTAGFTASTHIFPLSVLSRFLVDEVGCQVVLLGIQPKCLDFDAGVSEAVWGAIQRVTQDLVTRCGQGNWESEPDPWGG